MDWSDTLCRRAIEERRYTDDVAAHWGDSQAAQALGIRTYLEQPGAHLVRFLYGTCVAPAPSANPGGGRNVIAFFARLIAEQVEREQLLLQQLQRANDELSARPSPIL